MSEINDAEIPLGNDAFKNPKPQLL